MGAMNSFDLHRLLNRAVAYLENNLTQPASVSEAAWHVGYSRYHFSRTFLATTGITPADYLRKRRLSEAARVLTQSSRPILEIALDYQFQSQEAFTRSFRQQFGISPGSYRRRRRLERLLHPLRIGCANLFYPGRGLSGRVPILLPERKVAAAVITTEVQPGVYLFQMVTTPAKPTITVRLAHRQDLPALCQLYYELHEFTTRGVPDRLRSLGDWECYDATWLTGELEKLLNTLDVTIWVAEVDGQVAGLAEVYLRSNAEHPDTVAHWYGYLQSLVVMPHLRGRGIGAHLLSAAERWSKEQGASELQLDTWEFDTGPLGFYRQKGYQTLKRTLVRKL